MCITTANSFSLQNRPYLPHNSGVSNMLGIPMEVKDVKPEHVKTIFPPNDIVTKWHAGEDADWPPMDDEYELDENNMPRLRFVLG